jgi:hypothetical protein
MLQKNFLNIRSPRKKALEQAEVKPLGYHRCFEYSASTGRNRGGAGRRQPFSRRSPVQLARSEAFARLLEVVAWSFPAEFVDRSEHGDIEPQRG